MKVKEYVEYLFIWLENRTKSICYSTQLKYEQLIKNHIVSYFAEYAEEELSEEILIKFYASVTNKPGKCLSDSNLRTIIMIINSSLDTREQIVSYMLENGFKLGDSPYSLADEYNGLVEKAIASGSSIWRERYGLHVD